MADKDMTNEEAAAKAIENDKKKNPGKYGIHEIGPAEEGPSPGRGMASGSYKISEGDTFTSIAKTLGISVKALMAANPNKTPKKLQIGSSIELPKLTDEQRKEGQTVPRSQSVRKLERLKPATLEQHKKSGIDAAVEPLKKKEEE